MALTAPVTAALTDLIGSAIDTILNDNEDKLFGIVLSGGLDSSTVASLAPAELPTFTGYYDEPGFDERAYAHLVSHSEHYDIRITPDDFVEHFDAMKRALYPLRCGMGAFGQFMVAKFLSEHDIDIAMSGEGSDELFGGYARLMMVAGEPLPVGYEGYQPAEGYPTELGAALAYDYAALPALLAVDDQMLGAWGLEARAPFTDSRIVEYGLGLPDTSRVGKRHLREAVRYIVPDEIIDRKDKIGFACPLVLWANKHPGVGEMSLARVGYIPDPSKPFDRSWWYDLLDA